MRNFESYEKQYSWSLKAQALRLTNNPDQADDLYQTTIMYAWRSFDRYDREKFTFLAWALSIMRNAHIDMSRKKSRRIKEMLFSFNAPKVIKPEMIDDEWIFTYGDVANQTEDPAENIINKSVSLVDAAEAMKNMPLQTRKMMAMVANGDSYEVIGERFNMPSVTARTTIYRARQKANRELEKLAV